MATQRDGTFSASYTAPGTTSLVTVNMGTRPFNLNPGEAKFRSAVDNLQRNKREVVTVGPGNRTLQFSVRLHDTPDELVAMEAAALDGAVVTWSSSASGNTFASVLTQSDGVTPDADKAGSGWYQFRGTWRHNSTAGGSWAGINSVLYST